MSTIPPQPDKPRLDDKTGRWTFPPAFGMERAAALLPEGLIKWPSPFDFKPRVGSRLCTMKSDPSTQSCDILAKQPIAAFDPSQAPTHLCQELCRLTTARWAAPLAYAASLDITAEFMKAWAQTWPLPVGREALARRMATLADSWWLHDEVRTWTRLFPVLPFAHEELAAIVLIGAVGENRVTAFGLVEPVPDLWVVPGPRHRLRLANMLFVVEGPNPTAAATKDLVDALRLWWAQFEGKPIGRGRRPGSGRRWETPDAFWSDVASAQRRCRGKGQSPNDTNVAFDLGVSSRTIRNYRRRWPK